MAPPSRPPRGVDLAHQLQATTRELGRSTNQALMECSAHTSAQAPQSGGNSPQPGRTKISVGVTLLTAGLMMAVIRPTPPTVEDDRIPVIGACVAMTGGTLIFIGQRDKLKARAHQPTTTVGVILGRTPTIQFQRSW